MTLTDKPLSELQALRDRQASELAETEAAIAAKGATLEAELTSVFKELHWAFTDWQVKRVADHLKRTALQRLAPAEPVDDEIKPFPCTPGPILVSAEPVDDGDDEGPCTDCWDTGETQNERECPCGAGRTTLSRCARWPGEAELREMAFDVRQEWFRTVPHVDGVAAVALEMARRLRTYQTGAAS